MKKVEMKMLPQQTLPRSTLFLARSLDGGGAERQLAVLAKGLAKRGHKVAVAVFYVEGTYGTELMAHGVRVIGLGKKGRWDAVPFMFRLARAARNEHPAILHSYLCMPNILASMLKPLLSGTRIVWGVRASNMDLSQYDWFSRLSYAVECRLARFADCIIANSEAGKRYSIENGFEESKMLVIPNGIDTEYFQFSQESRNRVRAEWGIDKGEILIGIAARLDPMKDHQTFFDAVARVAQFRPNVRIVCVGGGPADYAATLNDHATHLGFTDNLQWVGSRPDMSAVYSAFDISCSSSSYGEGFSNSIAEAMACGVPCVATDVGDAAFIIGDTGQVVASRATLELAAAIQRLVDMSPMQRRAMGQACRERIVSEFNVDRLIQRTEKTLGLT